MTDHRSTSRRYFLAVDGFRLLASVNIVLFHLQGIGGLWDLREKPEWLFLLIKGPALHASIFFLLGGFIFTIKFAGESPTFDTWHFVKKRFAELFPLHCITTIIMALLYAADAALQGTFDLPRLIFSLFMHLSLAWSVIPFGSLPLNRPSWALSAFFLCYLLFGVALKRIMKLKSTRECIGCAVVCMVPIVAWTMLFKTIGMPESLYHFFHTFAPIRFFEFLLGMLLARIFLLSEAPKKATWGAAISNDVMIIAAGIAIFKLLQFPNDFNQFSIYFNYHVTTIPLYFIILWGLACEKGVISRLLSLPLIRKTGRSSFYPYLIHIPLISIITFISERFFSHNYFLHRPLNVVIVVVLLYAGAYLYVNHVRVKKR